MLIGRVPERERLHRLLAEALTGMAGAIVVRGEAGIGKTALLEDVALAAGPAQVVWVRGLEAEQEIPFVGLLAACTPFLDVIDALPAWQADAIRGALALGPQTAPGPLAVGAGTLSLLGAAAAERPLLLLVDDAQWLDAASIEALLFSARRLDADAIAIVFAARDGEPTFAADGLEEVQLSGLAVGDAHELMRSASAACAPSVAHQLIEVTAGNPLALLELPAMLSEDQLSGREPLQEPVRLSARVEQSFERRANVLGEPVRQALVVAAAAGSDAGAVNRALAASGLDPGLVKEASDAGLLQLGDGETRFRHPLVRSAVYHGAAPSERRAAHLALSSAYSGIDEDRQAWHLSMAAVGHDEDAAALLEASGRRYSRRGAHLSAANTLERAARLGSDGEARVRRLLAAGEAAWAAGAAARAEAIVGEALAVPAQGELRADLVALLGRIVSRIGTQERAYAAFVEAADITRDQGREAAFLGEAVLAAVQLTSAQLRESSERLRRLGGGQDAATQLLVAQAHTAAESLAGTGDPDAWQERAADAADRLLRSSPSARDYLLAGRANFMFGRNDAASVLASRGILGLQRGEAANILAELLRLRAAADCDRGAWHSAYASAAEAVEIAGELGLASTACACLGLLAELDAAMGNADACRTHANRAVEIAVHNHLAFFRERAERAIGRLDILVGDIDAGIEQLEAVARRLREAGNHELNLTPVPDLVEAYVRLGNTEQARAVLARLGPYVDGLRPNEEALLRRCNGLVAADDTYRDEFEGAIELGAMEPFPFEQARTQLALGERLRRSNQPREARLWLRRAQTMFDDLGASAWATRTEAELHATGLRRSARPQAREHLTPRESQIAYQLTQGRSNKEIAAELYLTPKTVEFHLTRIYRKLGVRSRAQLTKLYTERATTT
jgi:DNA-binding CsgD family transcriptional regulator